MGPTLKEKEKKKSKTTNGHKDGRETDRPGKEIFYFLFLSF